MLEGGDCNYSAQAPKNVATAQQGTKGLNVNLSGFIGKVGRDSSVGI
jgi:hypothetical protein